MTTGELLSIGGVAELVGRSPALLRVMEDAGEIPRALRLVGSDRRVYRVEDVPRIREAIANRRGPGRPSVGRSTDADDGPPEAA
ncbi:MAG TPA: hypothetical protein VIL85_23360 [Thermomicrobiales bacterium]|jgi:hypothetical protein